MRISLGKVSLWAHIRLLTLFALVFAMVAAGLSLYMRVTSPMPDMVVLSPKLEIYRADAAKYDTVFIGTSRTLYHIIPETIATTAEAAGCQAPSVFNFGVHGLTGAEQDWLIAEVLKAGKGHLSRIILEDPLPEARSTADVSSTRARFFHGPALYKANLDSILSFPESTAKRLFRTGIFAYGIGYDLSGVGRAAERAFPEAAIEGESDIPKFRREHGFEALDEIANADIEARREDFLRQPQQFADALDKYSWGDSPNLNARANYMIDKLTALRDQGLDVALYVSPDPLELDRTPQVGKKVAELAPDLHVLNYNRPDAYPEFFSRDLWHDFSHVTRQGATLLSAQIGADFCQTFMLEELSDAVR
ncbi:MAG: hypothetical protein ABJG15_01820 [Hyphomonadaceae bacterium]